MLCNSAHLLIKFVIAGLAKSDARGYHLFPLGYQKLSIYVSILSSPVARKVIRATKHDKDLQAPELISKIFIHQL